MAKTKVYKNYDSFLKREDKSINGVTKEFAQKHGIDLDLDNGNKGCWNCRDCKECYRCVCCADLAGGIFNK